MTQSSKNIYENKSYHLTKKKKKRASYVYNQKPIKKCTEAELKVTNFQVKINKFMRTIIMHPNIKQD